MKIANRIHLVGSGRAGFNITDAWDCHVYLIDGGSEYALIDAGAGRAPEQILEQIEADGLDLSRVRHLMVTHAHADHAGGVAAIRERLGLTVVASADTAAMVRSGDEATISLDAARRAGVYPDDYVFRWFDVDVEVADGAMHRVGEIELQAIATPGHSSGQMTYVMRDEGTVAAFCGDTVFAGGKILLQDIWDCSVQESCRSIETLDALDIDGLYPGHLAFAVQRGRDHIAPAMAKIRQLLPPDQMA
jgi:hydroxyacylglutathione hydrolase